MNYETKEQIESTLPVELEEAELENIAVALQVRSGVRAGLQPCL
jgi:hypothetical protein